MLVRFQASHFAADKKKESSLHLPSVAESDKEKCILTLLSLFVSVIPPGKFWDEFTSPWENGLNKMADRKKHKF